MNIEKGFVNYKQTIKDIFNFAEKFQGDVGDDISNLNIWTFFDYVKRIPYVSDGVHPLSGEGLEILHRPLYILNGTSVSCDCDDKTLLVGAYAEKKKIPWAIGVSGKIQPEHVFPMLFWQKKELIFDATYPENEINTIYPKNPGYLEVFLKNGKKLL